MKKIILSLLTFITAFLIWMTPVHGEGEIRCYDGANLLTSSKQQELNDRLNSLSHKHDFDIFVVTTQSLEGKTSTAYADDFFDEHMYGMGSGEDGILLLISMENRDWAISTCGFGIQAFTDAGQEYMVSQFKPYLSDGDFDEAFDCFVDLCDDYIVQAKKGKPYDSSSLPKKPIQLYWIVIAIIGGCLVSFIIMMCFKAQLKTVRYQPYAGDYVSNLKINRQQDLYLYRNVTRRRKPEKTSSSGSSTHRSSSGRTHGGSSGHF